MRHLKMIFRLIENAMLHKELEDAEFDRLMEEQRQKDEDLRDIKDTYNDPIRR